LAECGLAPPLRSLPELAEAAPRAFTASDGAEVYNGAPRCLLRLHEACAARDIDAARIAVLRLSNACEFTSRGPERLGELAGRAQRGVIASGGYLLLVRLLREPWASSPLQDVRREAAAVLRELCFSDGCFSAALASCPGFPELLVSLAADATLLEPVVALAEEVLPARAGSSTLLPPEQLCELLRAAPSAGQLAVLARLIAVLLHDCGVEEEEGEAFGPPPEAPRFVAENADSVLAAPGLLPRLVALLQSPRVPSPAISARVLSHPAARLLLQRMPHIALALLPMLESLVAGGPDAPEAPPPPPPQAQAPPPQAHATPPPFAPPPLPPLAPWAEPERPSHRPDVLVLLSALLSGPRKAAAQDALGAAGFASAAAAVFQEIDWLAPAPPPHAPGLHGPGCSCNSHTALRVGLLRTIHAFLERESENCNKRLLLSSAELAEAPRAYPPSPSAPPRASVVAAARRRLSLCFALGSRAPQPPPPPLPPPPAATGAPPAPGLIVRIASLLTSAPAEEPHFFWAASCCEAFLRGNDARGQALLAQAGLLDRLSQLLLDSSAAPPAAATTGALQVCCDLLGELVKFNRPLVVALDARLACGGAALQRMLLDRLVDTNVLLRSLLLSMHSFVEEDLRAAAAAAAAQGAEKDEEEEPEVEEPPACCEWLGGVRVPPGALFRWLASAWMPLLRSLVGAIAAEAEVNSETVCLVNTALLMLQLTRRSGRLPAALSALRATPRAPDDPRPPPCASFARLLSAWRRHYCSSRNGTQRDRLSLAYSSRVPLADWESIVALLSGPADHPCSLAYSV